jgi:hypothetical protein
MEGFWFAEMVASFLNILFTRGKDDGSWALTLFPTFLALGHTTLAKFSRLKMRLFAMKILYKRDMQCNKETVIMHG